MNEVSRELVKKIDVEIEAHMKNEPNARLGDIVEPYITKIATEAGVDPVDLLVDYMDHVAINSKKVGMRSENEQIFGENEVDSPDFKLY